MIVPVGRARNKKLVIVLFAGARDEHSAAEPQLSSRRIFNHEDREEHEGKHRFTRKARRNISS